MWLLETAIGIISYQVVSLAALVRLLVHLVYASDDTNWYAYINKTTTSSIEFDGVCATFRTYMLLFVDAVPEFCGSHKPNVFGNGEYRNDVQLSLSSWSFVSLFLEHSTATQHFSQFSMRTHNSYMVNDWMYQAAMMPSTYTLWPVCR